MAGISDYSQFFHPLLTSSLKYWKVSKEIENGGASHRSECLGLPSYSSIDEDAIELDANDPFLFIIIEDGHPIWIGICNQLQLSTNL
ncbi:hypothetical protein CAEBREN_24440 [Caenorhabditis brenneri]|uniref:Uncharacterized protein n=1 Tax=Caenorhabditis brenneri TaxID=135651 RepID=G0NX18_CAEBE|nr:hypothetical protein CAEBREN_24440 [Caenorhabditis brenneri]